MAVTDANEVMPPKSTWFALSEAERLTREWPQATSSEKS